MIPKDEQEFKLFAAVGQGQLGQEFIKLLERRLQELDVQSRKQSGEVILVTNGRRQELEEIIDSLRKSPGEAQGFKNRRAARNT